VEVILVHRIGITALLIPVIQMAFAEDVRSVQLGPFAYDLAIVIPQGEFREDAVLSKLGNFALQQQSRHKLSRMTIALSGSDLRYALPTEAPYVPGNYGRDWSAHRFVAQAWCVNGAASAMVKFGESVKYFQLLGKSDPSIIKIGERSVKLASFRISGGTGTDQLYSLESPTASQLVRFYAVAKPMLSLPEAERLLAVLRSSFSTEDVGVIVRPDSAFGENGGPVLDVFHPPYPDLSEEAYVATSYIVCLPEGRPSSKRGRLGAAVCKITKPGPLHSLFW
jgi:hypothetical protein